MSVLSRTARTYRQQADECRQQALLLARVSADTGSTCTDEHQRTPEVLVAHADQFDAMAAEIETYLRVDPDQEQECLLDRPPPVVVDGQESLL